MTFSVRSDGVLAVVGSDGNVHHGDGETPSLRKQRKNNQMATKTKAIEVKVDERLAEAISDKAVKAWHATNYSNGRKRVYVTFEEVVSA